MDPIANMLTCVRNASQAQMDEVAVPHSKVKENIARILKRHGHGFGYIVDLTNGRNEQRRGNRDFLSTPCGVVFAGIFS